MKTLKWFTSRIKKRIYRNDDGCPCRHCLDILNNGLVITDKSHAQYLFDVENDYGAEGIKLDYRDAKHPKS